MEVFSIKLPAEIWIRMLLEALNLLMEYIDLRPGNIVKYVNSKQMDALFTF